MAVRWLSVFLFSLIAEVAQATSLLDEAFDYAPGPLVGVSAGVWSTHSGTAGEVVVSAGRAFITDTNTKDVSASLTQTFAPASGTILYARFTLSCTKLPSAAGD